MLVLYLFASVCMCFGVSCALVFYFSCDSLPCFRSFAQANGTLPGLIVMCAPRSTYVGALFVGECACVLLRCSCLLVFSLSLAVCVLPCSLHVFVVCVAVFIISYISFDFVSQVE